MARNYKNIIQRTLVRILVALVVLPIILYFLLQSTIVQNFVTTKVANYLSDKLNTKVTVGKVNFSFFNSFIISQLYIEDLNEDTLAYIAKIKLNLMYASVKNNNFKVSKFYIDSLKFYIHSDTVGNANINFLIDYFASPDDTKDTTKSQNITISIADIEITNSKFYYIEKKDTYPKNIVDFQNIITTDININITDFYLNEDTISLSLDTLKMKEHNGFILYNLKTKLMFNNNEIFAKYFDITTNNSHILFQKIHLRYDSLADFDDFLNKVKIQTEISKTAKINTADLSFFVPTFQNINEDIFLNFNIDGTINKLLVNKLDLKTGENTHLNLRMKINGLPDLDNTYFDLQLDTLQTTRDDITGIRYTHNYQPVIVMPEILNNLKIVNYKAHIVGIVNNFNVKGDLFSNLGTAQTNIKILHDSSEVTIAGEINAKNLELGTFIQDTATFGKVTFDNKIHITIDKNQEFVGSTEGTVSSIYINGYNYRNITLDGIFSNESYNGTVNIDDDNLKTKFVGNVSFEEKIPVFDFKLDLIRANLFQLKLEKEDSNSYLKTEISAKFKGATPDEINGEIYFSKPLEYQKNLQLLKIDTFRVNSYITHYTAGKENKIIKIKSDYFDGEIKGLFEFATLIDQLKIIATKYIPARKKEKSKTELAKSKTEELNPFELVIRSNFEFKINLYKIKTLTDIFLPGIDIADSTLITGKYRDMKNIVNVVFNFDTKFLNYNDIIFNNLKLKVNTESEKKVNIKFETSDILLSETIKIDTLKLSSTIENDTIDFTLNWLNNSVKLNRGVLHAKLCFEKDTIFNNVNINTQFLEDTFYVNNSQWIMKNFRGRIDSTGFDILDLNILNIKDKERIIAAGKVSENPKEEILIRVLNFNLQTINGLIDDIKLEGIVLSEIKITDALNEPIINSHNIIKGLKLNDVLLGRLIVKTDWINDSSKIKINVFTQRIQESSRVDIDSTTNYLETQTATTTDTLKSINIVGDYYLKDKTIDILVNLNRFSLRTLAPYLSDMVDRISPSAYLNGSLQLKGSTEKPIINGDFDILALAFRSIQTNVSYTFQEAIKINLNNKNINISKAKLTALGMPGHAYLSGKIVHNMFDNMFLDINISSDNLLFYNTEKTDSMEFYGKVFASGEINLSGAVENMKLKSQLVVDKGTELYYLLNIEEISDEFASFITFAIDSTLINPDLEDIYNPEEMIEYTGVEMDMNIRLSPDAKLQLVFDQTIGDIINIQGEGDLNVKMNSIGDVSLFGKLILLKGDYMFSMKNVVKKKFEIVKGGTIEWKGDVTDAEVNLSAVYKKDRVGLYDLLLENEYREERVLVECQLNATNNLMSPSITFDLNIPKVHERISAQIKNLDEENKNKQVISILILGRFQPLLGLTQTEEIGTATPGAGGVINTSEILSNQINQWISQANGNFDMSIDYQGADAVNSEKVEIELSKGLWDDKIIINGNVGYGGELKANQSTNAPIVGDVNIEMKLNKTGNVKFKVFNEANDDDYYQREKGAYTQGAGIFYKKEFDHWFKKKTDK